MNTYKIANGTSDIKTAYILIGGYSRKLLRFSKSAKDTLSNPNTLLSCELAIINAAADVNPKIMVDYSHGNSMKKHENQKKVCLDICKQLEDGIKNIVGAMIESHLKSLKVIQRHRKS